MIQYLVYSLLFLIARLIHWLRGKKINVLFESPGLFVKVQFESFLASVRVVFAGVWQIVRVRGGGNGLMDALGAIGIWTCVGF